MPEPPPAAQQSSEPPPPPIETPIDLWEPAGDPEALERAAAAWEQAAAQLTGLRQALDARIGALNGRWTGQARQGFDATWAARRAALADGVQACGELAALLRDCAHQIRQTNQQIQAIYRDLAIDAAITVAAGMVSFGFGAAAGAARAKRLIDRARQLKRLLRLYLAARRALMAAVRTNRITRFTAHFLAGAGENLLAETASKAVEGGNPLDPRSWDAGDALAVGLGGVANPAAAGLGRRLASRLASRPLSPDELETFARQGREALDRAKQLHGSLVERSRRFQEKTVAADGQQAMSGWEQPRPPGLAYATPAEVRALADRIGHEFPGHIGDQLNRPDGWRGKYHASHAEKQLAVRSPGDPIAVFDKLMCFDCQKFFRRLAQYDGMTHVVTDRSVTRVFLPDGQVVEIPR